MSEAEYAVRRLGPDELDLMRELLALFGDVFAEPDTYGGAVPDDAYLARLLGKPTFIVLVAIANGGVIGGLAAYELEKFEQARSEIYIYDLAVAEANRRRGIATALIDRVCHIGAQCGAQVVFVQADPGDDPAVSLYTKLGRREDVHHFDIAVAGRHK